MLPSHSEVLVLYCNLAELGKSIAFGAWVTDIRKIIPCRVRIGLFTVKYCIAGKREDK
jgi:hypothetical protein